MKSIVIKIIVLFAFLPCFSLNAQNKVDSILFDMINKYRVQHRLAPFVWDTCVFKMAQHHSQYLVALDRKQGKTSGRPIKDTVPNILTHKEDVELDSIISLRAPSDRLNFYCKEKVKQDYGCAENAIASNFDSQVTDFIVAKDIFERWEKSPGHNKNMLIKSKKTIYSACSYKEFEGTMKIKLKDKIFNKKLIVGFSTLNILISVDN